MESSPSIVFLRHQSALIRLTRPDGPNTLFKVFGSPHSQFKGNWAFGYEDADGPVLWDQIPLDADVVVTHTPPHSHCDRKSTGESKGCKALRQALSDVRPMLSICGHVHESRGYERVRWPLTSPSSCAGVEQYSVIRGVLPPLGSKKQSLVDLTGKKAQRLDNDGFSNYGLLATSLPPSQDTVILPSSRDGFPDPNQEVRRQAQQMNNQNDFDDRKLEIRSRRKETCIVNAAIMANSWPHRGGKKFNTPIVVDLELPVWKEGTEQ